MKQVSRDSITRLFGIPGFRVATTEPYFVEEGTKRPYAIIEIVREKKEYQCPCGQRYERYYDGDYREVRDLPFGKWDVYLVFFQVRVECPHCGVKTERLDWLPSYGRNTTRLEEYVARLCAAIIEQGLRIAWTCNSRVDTVDQQLLKQMAQAGCWMISFGIESAEQAVLYRAEKGTTVAQARAAVAAARRAGIKTAGHFIFGLPGDTPQAMECTITFAKSLPLDIAQFYCCAPFPGSRLYDEAIKEGWISGRDFSCVTQTGAVMNLPTVSPAGVNRARARAYRSFYGRPVAWYRAAAMLAGGSITGLWQALRRFMRWQEP